MRNVLVTGGSRGIGLAIVQRLSAAGYGVIAVARRESEELSAAMKAAGGQGAIHFLPCDLGEIDRISDFVKSTREKFGPLYGLVNNAGISFEGLLANTHNSQIEQIVRVNVVSPIVLTKFVVRHMMADGGGRVVNIGSIIGSTGYNGLAVYGATKAAANGFSRSLAREVGRAGITVNTIAPGFIETELTKSLDAEQKGRIASRSALRRLPGTDDVASMVEYLLGDGAKNITGTVMTVDAGNTA
jgi:3-oxoacyl-[acyl-carrier protein] reductase